LSVRVPVGAPDEVKNERDDAGSFSNSHIYINFKTLVSLILRNSLPYPSFPGFQAAQITKSGANDMQTSSFAVENHSGSDRIAGRFLLIALLALIFCPLSAFAQGCTSPTFTWSGGASGSWNTTTNWTPNGTPTTSSNTCINTANSAVTVSNGSTGTLQLGLSTDSLGISDNTTLTVAGSSIINAGTISMNSIGDTTELNIAGTTTLTGAGTFTMSDHLQNYILGGGTFNNASTIQGSGTIGNSNLTLGNSGTIDGNQSVELLINPNGGTTNSGTMEATAGGTLEIRGASVTNTGGTILSTGTNSVVDLNGVSITNGTLTTASGGLMQAYGGTTLTTVTISTGSTLNVLDNNTVNLGAGTITNNGTISENSAGNTTELNVTGSTTLSGIGTLTMSDHVQNYILGGGTFTNNETIQGAGTIGNANLTLVNNGTIDANQSVALLINTSGGTTNTKTLEATAGGTLQITGSSITNTGVGTILSTGASSLVNLSGVTINGGTLTTASGGVMQAYGSTILNGVTLSTGSALRIPDNQVAALTAGTITNNGTINLNSIGDTTELQIVGGAVTLTGGGSIVMTDKTQNFIFNASGGTSLENVNNTISGSGVIGDSQGLIFKNDAGGIVDAVSATGKTLTINPGTGTGIGTTNLGLLEASSGGTLVLNNTVTNTGGTITALNGGVVDVAGTDLIGGTLTSSGTGVINGYGSALLDGTSGHAITLTAGSNFVIPDNQVINAAGTLTNNGTLTIASVGDNTELLIGSSLTLTGTGTLTMSPRAQNYIFGGGTLTNQETIQGSGVIGNSNLTLVNSGTIDANQSAASLTINPNGGTTNTSTMEATAGGTLVFAADSVTNTGVGTILATGTGSVVDFNGATVIGGTLTTSSGGLMQAYNGAVFNGVTISTGSTVNVLDNNTVNFGAGTITNNGTINLNSVGDNTLLSIAGSTTLAGTGTLTLSPHLQNFILGGGTLTNQETIQGSGVIGNNNLTLFNNGTIDANVASELVINPNGGTTNTKTMEATAGGTMEFRGDAVTNTGVGTILATGAGSIVDFNGATVNGGTLTTSAGGLMQAYLGAVLNGVTLSSGSTLNVLDNNTVNIEGTITNKGTINENSIGDNTFITLLGNTTLTGTGKLVLSPHTQNFINGSFTLTNQSTIEGEGHIGNGDLTLVNTGSILANEHVPSTLLIDTGAGGFTNSSGTKNGILNVSAKNTLVIEGGLFNNFSAGTLTGGTYIVAGTLEFAAGTGLVTNQAAITLTGATAAILNTSNGNSNALTTFADNGTKGTFTVNGFTFTDANNFTNSGTLAVGGGAEFYASNGLTNFNNTNGTLTGGTYNLTGTGQLKFNNEGFTNDIVTNAAHISLSGVDTTKAPIIDQTGANALANFNTNASAGSLTLSADRQFTTGGSLSNAGTVTVMKSMGTGTTALIIGGTGNYSQTAGTTTVDGKLTTAGAINISGGFVYGNAGTLTGAFSLTGGTLNPGDGIKKAGVLNITGTYAQSGAGILNIDLGGTVAGTKYDVLNVSGAASLGGTLNVDLLTGFTPVPGNTFDILNSSAVSGTFTITNLPTVTGDHWTITYNATDVVLTLVAGPVPPASASVAKTAVSASPAPRVSRGMGALVASAYQPVAILSHAITCFGARLLGSGSCGKEAVASVSHGAEMHATASLGAGTHAVHNNIMVATRSISAARGGASHETSASATAMARLYVCAYMPSTVAHTMGCN
jgi:fibronectin-binding autotransporter adhesin